MQKVRASRAFVWVLAVCLAAGLALSLTGCGGASDGDSGDPATVAIAEVRRTAEQHAQANGLSVEGFEALPLSPEEFRNRLNGFADPSEIDQRMSELQSRDEVEFFEVRADEGANGTRVFFVVVYRSGGVLVAESIQ